MDTPTCPLCHSIFRQIKNGHTIFGTPQYRCQTCHKTYIPHPKQQGYPQEIEQKAGQMYREVLVFRRIARLLSFNHQSVANWVNAAHAALPTVPQTPAPESVQVIEMDELLPLLVKKSDVYLVTLVERASRCFVAYAVTRPRCWRLHSRIKSLQWCKSRVAFLLEDLSPPRGKPPPTSDSL